MIKKTLTLLTLLATFAAARAVTVPSAKTPTVTITDETSYPADEAVDCEYVVTPTSMTAVSGHESC